MFLLIGISLLYTIAVHPLTEKYPLVYSVHMLEISVLFFVIPPLLLLGLPNVNVKAFKRPSFHLLLQLTPYLSLILFAMLLTLEHSVYGIKLFEQLQLTSSSLHGFMFFLAMDMWRPLIHSHKRNLKKFVHLSMYVLVPACSFLLFDAFFSPINSIVSTYSLSFCLPTGMTFVDIPSVILPPRIDQGIAAFIMIGCHKGSLGMVNRIIYKD